MAAAPVYIPSGLSKQTYGSTVPRADLPAPPAGTRCRLVVYVPLTFRINVDGSVSQFSAASPYSGPGSPELVGGQLVNDPPMGEIWVQSSDWTCATPDSRRTFGPLCNL